MQQMTLPDKLFAVHVIHRISGLHQVQAELEGFFKVGLIWRACKVLHPPTFHPVANRKSPRRCSPRQSRRPKKFLVDIVAA
jgi:hypothetical protein